MAKNVVLKDRDGNELNVGKLYKHEIGISGKDEEKCIEQIYFYSTDNTTFTTYEEFYNYYVRGKNFGFQYCCFWDHTQDIIGVGLVGFQPTSVRVMYGGDVEIAVRDFEVFEHFIYEV